MKNDLSIYEKHADTWWSGETRWLRTLHKMAPARMMIIDPLVGDWSTNACWIWAVAGASLRKNCHVEAPKFRPRPIAWCDCHRRDGSFLHVPALKLNGQCGQCAGNRIQNSCFEISSFKQNAEATSCIPVAFAGHVFCLVIKSPRALYSSPVQSVGNSSRPRRSSASRIER